ncbi:MAG: chromosomal replication initiator protein DnaA, partial [Sphaerochaetaceae bacterium]|nr:chromosomal replication initiator protein DnaA [Sphaerochaetaceae bacterium]
QIMETIPNSNSWLSRLTFISLENNKALFYVPSKFVMDKMESTYLQPLENTLSTFLNKPISVVLEINKNIEKQPIVKEDSNILNKTNENKILNSDISQQGQKKLKKNDDMMLNPSYTFDSFVPGDNSSFAYNACFAIAKNPGSAYNPCLLYGGVGLGKTHLIQSVGNYIRENSNLKVAYVTAENFTNEFIDSINKNPQQFRNKYRKVNVLLIDDIHFFQDKQGTQQELFNTFNDLYDTGRQIIFTCDRPIEELKNISDRLRSRFSRGLCIDLLPPNYETRVAILKKKCEEKNFICSDEVIEYIAKNISSNVRALESCLTKLMAYSDLLHVDISLDIAKEQLKNIIYSNNDTSGISIELIIKVVSSYFNLTPFDIKGKNRKKSVAMPRQIAMYLCRKLTDYSTTEIALEFGGKNHTSVMYNVDRIESLVNSTDNDTSAIVTKLTNQ